MLVKYKAQLGGFPNMFQDQRVNQISLHKKIFIIATNLDI